MNQTARIALPAVIGLLPVAAVLTPTSLVPLGIAGAVVLLTDAGVRAHFTALLRAPLSRAIASLLIWGAISAIWAPSPWRSLLLVLQVAGVMLTGGVLVAAAACLDDQTRRRAIGALAAAGPILILLAASELVDKGFLARAIRGWPDIFVYNPVRYDRAAAIGAIVAWPIGLVLWRRVRPGAAILFLVLIFVLLLQLEMAAARLAFVAAGFIHLASLWKPRAVLNVLTAGALAAILLAPPVLIASGAARDLTAVAEGPPKLASSEKHRLYIAQFVLGHIGERPLFGFGFDSSRAIPGGKTESFKNAPELPLHPHNAILQIWLELGAVGATIAAAIALYVMRGMRAYSADRGAAASANAALTGFAAIALLSYGIWQNWWLMTAWLATLAVAVAVRTPPPQD